MSGRKGLLSSTSRAVALTAIAVLILTTSEAPLAAAPASRVQGILTARASGSATDVSSRHRYRHYRHGGGAAAAAFMGLAIGAIAGAVAAQQRRDEYDYYSGQGYYDAPGNYYGPNDYDYRPHYYHRHYYRPF